MDHKSRQKCQQPKQNLQKNILFNNKHEEEEKVAAHDTRILGYLTVSTSWSAMRNVQRCVSSHEHPFSFSFFFFSRVQSQTLVGVAFSSAAWRHDKLANAHCKTSRPGRAAASPAMHCCLRASCAAAARGASGRSVPARPCG